MNQVGMQGESLVILAQLKDTDILRMVHIIRDGELPLEHANFENIFSKTVQEP